MSDSIGCRDCQIHYGVKVYVLATSVEYEGHSEPFGLYATMERAKSEAQTIQANDRWEPDKILEWADAGDGEWRAHARYVTWHIFEMEVES